MNGDDDEFTSEEDTAEPMEYLAEIGMAEENVNSVEAESEELLNILHPTLLPLQPRHLPSFEYVSIYFAVGTIYIIIINM